MSPVWDKLFKAGGGKNAGVPARFEPEIELTEVTHFPPVAEASSPAPVDVASTFDSIGWRNESLRAKLDSVEYSFRNIEEIRSQFHGALVYIDQILADIERTKVAQLEAERKLDELRAMDDRLRSDNAALTVERDALALVQEELSARVGDLERMASAAEAAASAANATLAERSAKLEQVERELEDTRRTLQAVSEQLPTIRTEFAAKGTRLQEVEEQRASLHDQRDLLAQENGALRVRIEDLVVEAAKLNRQLSELIDHSEDLSQRLTETDAALKLESAAHAKLKASHLDATEAHKLNEASLSEQLATATARLETAERLLAEARAEGHERDAKIRDLEQRVLEGSLAAKSTETRIADLEKDLADARGAHMEVEVARTATADWSTELAKTLEEKETALRRAEQKITSLQTRLDEEKTCGLAERAALEEKVARLKERLEAESAARSLAEGALQSARQERNARRQEGDAHRLEDDDLLPSPEAPAALPKPTTATVTRLRG